MGRFLMILLGFAVGAASFFGSGQARAQEAGEPPQRPVVTQSDIEKAASDLDASKLDEAVKNKIQLKLGEASDALHKAEDFHEGAKGFREAIEKAPLETEKLKAELAELPTAEEGEAVDRRLDLEELRKRTMTGRAELSDLESGFADTDTELSRIMARPVKIGARLTDVRTELNEINGRLSSFGTGSSSPSKIAERLCLEAEQESRLAELEMLDQERLSQSVREALGQVKREYDLRRLNLARGVQKKYEEQLSERMDEEVAATLDRVGEFEASAEDPKLEPLVAELRELADEFNHSSAMLNQVGKEQSSMAADLADMNRRYIKSQDHIALDSRDGAMVQVLMEERRSLPNPRALNNESRDLHKQLTEVRLASIRIDELKRDQKAVGESFSGASVSRVEELMNLRGELIGKLRANYRGLTQKLAILDADERAYINLIQEYRDYLDERLFWRQSSPPLNRSFFSELPVGFAWVTRAEGWREVIDAARRIPSLHPWWTAFVLIVSLVLLLFRWRLGRIIKEAGEQTHRISTDRYLHTFKALLATHLVTLPIPLVVAFIGWGLVNDPFDSDMVRGVGRGVLWTGYMTAAVSFLVRACRPKGLCEVHFDWNPESVREFRRLLLLIFVVQIPMMIVYASTIYEDTARPFNSFGRLASCLSNLWKAALFAYFLHPKGKIFGHVLQGVSEGILVRGRYLWYGILVAFPLVLVLLACLGYVTTANALGLGFMTSLWLILSIGLLYSLALRWFLIKERRMALDEALKRREQRRKVADSVEEGDSNEEVVRAEEAAMNLDDVGSQTRRLLQTLALIGVVICVWLQWSATIPDTAAAASAPVGEGVSLVSLIKSFLILLLGGTVIRNLPGIMELAGLRDSDLDPGTRYAVATIAQYACGVGIAMMLFHTLALDWSQFGWIAAALSVGLGFGLQEIVANFVCGIILLFERPIRVGDVVLVNGVSGTVTRIRMRATTITNWDREDLVVPNKEFIAGSLINTTLSNKINRVVVPVGVAYGSDVAQAMKILDEVGSGHPNVMADPGPVTTFEGFGESALSLKLCCYLPNRDNRLGATSEIYLEIDRRFKEAGIEIAFPQHDLHLRSVEDGALSSLRKNDSEQGGEG
ncbi:mechanosensitive ion channel domain-containing protein [Haloferula sp.]|uniref:mechanosensitive ion channel domain-containing protein n=1 Tax=Haloferula sp. TaxID=2497595 RepID=UPI00329D4124